MLKRIGACLVLVVLAAGLVTLCGCGASQPASDRQSSTTEGDSSSSSTQHHEEPEHESDYHQAPHEQEHPHQGGSTGATTPQSSQGSGKTAQVILGGRSFTIELADNPTAEAFIKMLPLQVEMSELDSNEKYVYLDSSLPSNPTAPGTVEAGDVMLFQGNCLVIFYETHRTSYSYTRIGKIADASALAQAVGAGAVSASFELK